MCQCLEFGVFIHNHTHVIYLWTYDGKEECNVHVIIAGTFGSVGF